MNTYTDHIHLYKKRTTVSYPRRVIHRKKDEWNMKKQYQIITTIKKTAGLLKGKSTNFRVPTISLPQRPAAFSLSE